MAETEENPQIDETRLQAIRRRIEEVAAVDGTEGADDRVRADGSVIEEHLDHLRVGGGRSALKLRAIPPPARASQAVRRPIAVPGKGQFTAAAPEAGAARQGGIGLGQGAWPMEHACERAHLRYES